MFVRGSYDHLSFNLNKIYIEAGNGHEPVTEDHLIEWGASKWVASEMIRHARYLGQQQRDLKKKSDDKIKKQIGLYGADNAHPFFQAFEVLRRPITNEEELVVASANAEEAKEQEEVVGKQGDAGAGIASPVRERRVRVEEVFSQAVDQADL